MSWVVIVSVLVMILLSLARIHVIIAILTAGIVAGLMSGLGVVESVDLLVKGMGGQSKTALSYILLGAFAVAISYTGITNVLVNYLKRVLIGKRSMVVLTIAAIASLSQNVIPIHIAFIPILIPPLLKLFDQMQLDRRAIATALTFGLKAPYIMIPAGYGLLFHETIFEAMEANGITISMEQINLSLLLPGAGMIIGLFIAVFITYRKPVQKYEKEDQKQEEEVVTFNRDHLLTVVAIIGALVLQLITDSLIIGALTGLVLMFVFFVVPFKQGDKIITEGITMMGTIAFVMLTASGFGHILEETGAVTALIESTSGFLDSNKALIAFILLAVGLVITIGIGSSFGTIPIIAALYVPIGIAAGFSPLAIAALIGTAGALGDAGSPASDSTMGPTSGLNADGQHHHIWDTCVPTFLHFNIPLFILGWIAALIF
ncbi:Na+/H+ antiporter family protein [Paraliobacillus salinarum]|uniref:Na+/H+ antiporter family protein n=1 Tax=Paraliobacillus salinarum TaxID=1158996 RepID=UPI0015F400A4|nr:Na+/H+ antiporter NhaC family protein [Paraliobacillus salinarum]